MEPKFAFLPLRDNTGSVRGLYLSGVAVSGPISPYGFCAEEIFVVRNPIDISPQYMKE